ncbi:hypothetical protein NDU88_001023 [Pleurodeles waltl]|uniref:Secreted protein n=1 Tax=Pleurodeles waltl TaxID=8319 RepID=A0AAV7THZ5_PLEWA|nr:hypothetical protein NDU88_001023 [Pleurodeles waltl]
MRGSGGWLQVLPASAHSSAWHRKGGGGARHRQASLSPISSRNRCSALTISPSGRPQSPEDQRCPGRAARPSGQTRVWQATNGPGHPDPDQ